MNNIKSVIQAYSPYKYAGTFVSIYETLCDVNNKKVEITFNYECLLDYNNVEDYFEVPYYNGVSFNEMSYESIRKNAFNDRNNEIINIINKYGVTNDNFITVNGELIGLDFEISINLEKVEEGRKSSNQFIRGGLGEDDYFVTHNATPTYKYVVELAKVSSFKGYKKDSRGRIKETFLTFNKLYSIINSMKYYIEYDFYSSSKYGFKTVDVVYY